MTHRSAREMAKEMQRWRAARNAAKRARRAASAEMLAAAQRLQAFVRAQKSNNKQACSNIYHIRIHTSYVAENVRGRNIRSLLHTRDHPQCL